MANWAQLIPDLLSIIAKKVELYEDFVAFRGVCTSWRSVAEKNNFCPLRQVPWLLLAGGAYDSRDFYSLTKGGMVHSVYLPEAKGKRIFSSLGWLITADIEGKMELLHPLSRSRIPLPDASKFTMGSMLRRAALSASPLDDAYGLMIAIGVPNELAYWRPGNDDWITIQTPQYNGLVEDVVYSGGQFYAMNFRGELFSVDIDNRTANLVGRLPNYLMGVMDRCCLVDSGGDLIAVLRKIFFHDVMLSTTIGTNYFQLLRFDSSYNCHVINDLGGGRSLFIGQCASVGGGGNIRPNCIYFTDADIGGGRDMRVYNLQHKEFIKDATLYHCNKGRSPLCPPVWVVPSF